MDKIEGWDSQVLVQDVTYRFLGISPRIEALRGAIAKVAQAHVPVLVTGEIGTGKELVARLIHERSGRAAGPFVAISGAAVAPAFFQPVANSAGPGRPAGSELDIDAASGGTLFIHEVGDLSAESQTALLLYLQRRDGDDREPSVRLVSSTHADLERRSHAGEFREDLYYRVASLRLDVPPLRERGPDIALLARHFLDDFSGARELRFDDHAQRQLTTHTWPGNVRELRNRVLQATVMCDGTHLTAQLLGLEEVSRLPREPAGSGVSLRETRHMAEREAITQALRLSHGQVPVAAAALGISRAQLYRLIGRLHVDHHLAHDSDQNGMSSSGKDSSIRAAGAGEPDPLRS
jgi:DNA-binding NtrC family response regulator